MNEELNNLRTEIDKIDMQIIKLLAKRLAIVKKIGLIKKQYNIAPLDKKRWNDASKKRAILASKYQIPIQLIKDIFNLIHKFALRQEDKIISDKK